MSAGAELTMGGIQQCGSGDGQPHEILSYTSSLLPFMPELVEALRAHPLIDENLGILVL